MIKDKCLVQTEICERSGHYGTFQMIEEVRPAAKASGAQKMGLSADCRKLLLTLSYLRSFLFLGLVSIPCHFEAFGSRQIKF